MTVIDRTGAQEYDELPDYKNKPIARPIECETQCGELEVVKVIAWARGYSDSKEYLLQCPKCGRTWYGYTEG